MNPPANRLDYRSDFEIISNRVFTALPAAVFAAFADPIRLARWSGPSGLTKHYPRI
ncbi:MAG: hypothetical protein H7343_08500 [Undibacterium sp.]|nr:hypothetical protein [Opitutaceae bacterium]